MNSILRTYDPHECDERGVPLGWERCRTCDGDGVVVTSRPGATSPRPCPTCHGHGCLRAAALAALDTYERRGRKYYHEPDCDASVGGVCLCGKLVRRPIRCEDCAHPLSEGTWEGKAFTNFVHVIQALHEGREPQEMEGVHYCPCDEECDHLGEHSRVRISNHTEYSRFTAYGKVGVWLRSQRLLDPAWANVTVQASWRQVDVRVGVAAAGMPGFDLSNPLHVRPFDLRPANVAVLCLRCYVERTKDD